jgi:hypothetical protein
MIGRHARPPLAGQLELDPAAVTAAAHGAHVHLDLPGGLTLDPGLEAMD